MFGIQLQLDLSRQSGGFYEGPFGTRRRGAGDEALLGRRPRVLTFPVPPEVNLPLEGLVAKSATERFVAGVFPEMSDEVRGLTESFPANDAFVRFFSCNKMKSNG